MARTNVVVDDKLVAECQKLTKIKTRRALIYHALQELLRREHQKKILELKGRVKWARALSSPASETFAVSAVREDIQDHHHLKTVRKLPFLDLAFVARDLFRRTMTIDLYFKLSSYILVTAGFAAVTAGGGVGIVAQVAFVCVLLCSWFVDTARLGKRLPPRIQNVLVLAYLLFYAADMRYLSRSFVISTVHLVIFLASIKLLTRSSDRDWISLYLISFAELLVASTLSIDVTFALSLLLFLFSFNMFPEVDPVLGPEMRSTGEVLGMAPSFGLAYFKAQAALSPLPTKGTVFISVTDHDKPAIVDTARSFHNLGFAIKATEGTCEFLRLRGVLSERSYKIHEHQRPNIADEIKSRQIDLIINTPKGKASAFDDA